MDVQVQVPLEWVGRGRKLGYITPLEYICSTHLTASSIKEAFIGSSSHHGWWAHDHTLFIHVILPLLLSPMLMTLFYHYVGLLYWPGDKKSQEIEWEQWNNAVYRHRQ